MTDICICCGAHFTSNATQYILNDRRKGLQGSWLLIECGTCGLISMDPRPTDKQLDSYYAAYSKDEVVDLAPHAGERYPMLRKIFHKLSGDVDPRDFVHVYEGARVLDYGCGHAGYLRDFHERGISIIGADIADYVVKACLNSGFDVRKVDNFSKIPFSDAEFDIIYLMQVFEHLRDPHRFLSELSRVLKKSGDLYIAVPNSASIWRKLFRKNWVSGWFAPFHLFHYNRNTLEKLAERHGFYVEKWWSNTPVMWFKLNLKAWLYSKNNQLDWTKSCLDSPILNSLLMLVLRIIELPFRDRDCLVIKFKKK